MNADRRTVPLLAAALSVALATMAVPSAANAAEAADAEQGGQYVALGSSYAAGTGLGSPSPSDAGGWCGRSTLAYPELVADELGLELVNATCGGATTANLASTPQVIFNQNGVHTVPLQIDAVSEDTDLVTITIGGNDVRYVTSLIAEACLGELAVNPMSPLALGIQPYGLCTPPSAADVDAALDQVEASIAAAVEAVREKAPGARLLLVDYLTVLPRNGKPCAALPIPQERQRVILAVARELSLATRHAASRTGAEFVAASQESIHHDACSADPWVTGFAPSAGMMHPNAAGHAAVAEMVEQQLAQDGQLAQAAS